METVSVLAKIKIQKESRQIEKKGTKTGGGKPPYSAPPPPSPLDPPLPIDQSNALGRHQLTRKIVTLFLENLVRFIAGGFSLLLLALSPFAFSFDFGPGKFHTSITFNRSLKSQPWWKQASECLFKQFQHLLQHAFNTLLNQMLGAFEQVAQHC